MKLAIFGGTGRTGRLLVSQALEANHALSLLARAPAKVEQSSRPGLTIVQGDLDNLAAIDQVIAGADAVIVATDPYAGGLANIISAMKRHGVRRLVVAAGAGVPVSGDKPTALNQAISAFIKLVSRRVYDAGVDFVRAAEGSQLDYTVARAPRLVEGPARGNLYTGPVSKEMGLTVTRADFATFLLQRATDQQWVGQSPVVANK
jgi:nucleoside-diphosphate-sugar epimerase